MSIDITTFRVYYITKKQQNNLNFQELHTFYLGG